MKKKFCCCKCIGAIIILVFNKPRHRLHLYLCKRSIYILFKFQLCCQLCLHLKAHLHYILDLDPSTEVRAQTQSKHVNWCFVFTLIWIRVWDFCLRCPCPSSSLCVAIFLDADVKVHARLCNVHAQSHLFTRALFQYPIRRLIVRSCKGSKPHDLYLELYDHFEIWQAPWQQCCRCGCQISKRCYNLNYQSLGFETSQDLTIRRLIGYWNGALGWGLLSKIYVNKDFLTWLLIGWQLCCYCRLPKCPWPQMTSDPSFGCSVNKTLSGAPVRTRARERMLGQYKCKCTLMRDKLTANHQGPTSIIRLSFHVQGFPLQW